MDLPLGDGLCVQTSAQRSAGPLTWSRLASIAARAARNLAVGATVISLTFPLHSY